MAFGGPSIDRVGLTMALPGNSMITGLLGNALGYRRQDQEALQRLQERMTTAARIDQEPPGGATFRDFQTANLGEGTDLEYRESRWTVGWTTRGRVETRAGNQNNYAGNQGQNRLREYRTDTKATAVLRLDPEEEQPDIESLAQALEQPRRILFIGRKSCTPSGRLFGGFAYGNSALEALLSVPRKDNPGYLPPDMRIQWEDHDPENLPENVKAQRMINLSDQKNWTARVHGGTRTVWTGTVPRTSIPQAEKTEEAYGERK